MASDVERREVAAMLRWARAEEIEMTVRVFKVIDEYIDPCARFPMRSMKAFFDRLADLIEPEPERTCRPYVWNDGIEECGGIFNHWFAECECGALLSEESSRAEALRRLPNYCPRCGARVVTR